MVQINTKTQRTGANRNIDEDGRIIIKSNIGSFSK